MIDLIPRPITSYVRASVVQTGGQMSSFSTMDDRETPSQKAYKATGNAEKYAILIEAFFKSTGQCYRKTENIYVCKFNC